MNRQMTFADWGFLLVLSLLWGGSFFFTEIALQELSALAVVWARVGFAALMLLIIVKSMGLSFPTDLRMWIAFGVMGVLNNVIPFSLIVWGQTEISGSLASILNATTPLFTIVLAQFLTNDEKLSVGKIAGIILGFCGVVVLIGPDFASSGDVAVWAQMVVLAAAISYGCAAIWGRRFAGLNPMITATGQVSCSAVMMTPLALIFGFPNGFSEPSLAVWGALLGIAFLCTVLAYILYFKILATSGATNLMLVTFLIPVSAIALGSVFLDERLSANQVAGMALILLGLLVVDGRILRRRSVNKAA